MARLTEERERMLRALAKKEHPIDSYEGVLVCMALVELLEELDATRDDRHKAEKAWAVELAQVKAQSDARLERIKSMRSSLGAKEGQADHEAVIAFLDKMRDLRLDNDNLHKRIQALYEDLKRKVVQEKILQGEIDTAIAGRESTLKALSVANAYGERVREERNEEYQHAEKAEADLAAARMDVAQIRHANAVLASEKKDLERYVKTFIHSIDELRSILGANNESVQDAARSVVAERDLLRGDIERMRQDHNSACASMAREDERLRVILGAASLERSTDAATRVVRERNEAMDQARVVSEARANLGLSCREPLLDATRRVANELLDARSDLAKARQERDAAIARAEKAEAADLLCDDCANGGAGPAGPCLACRSRDKWTPKAKPTETAEAERDAIQGALDAAVGARDALDSATQEQIARLQNDNNRLSAGLQRLWTLHHVAASGQLGPGETMVIRDDRMPGIISNLLEGKTWEGMDHVVGPAKAPPEVPAKARAMLAGGAASPASSDTRTHSARWLADGYYAVWRNCPEVKGYEMYHRYDTSAEPHRTGVCLATLPDVAAVDAWIKERGKR
jgi:hypothetical protein